MAALSYSREEILTEHDYAAPHEAAGYRLHGGLDAAGHYIPPRTKNRWPAVRAWEAKLAERGFPLLDADTDLLHVGPYPTFEQQRLLLQNGLGQTFWNSLTIVGEIEGRGRLLIDLPVPDFQKIFVEDVSETAIGHLRHGLIEAHGMDEGGLPGSGLGGHDEMWFAVRDLIFDAGAYPLPEVPENIARPDEGRLLPDLEPGYEQMILLLMNVLMIEVRAEMTFQFTQDVLSDPGLWQDRRDQANLGVEMVERIRTDEAVHLAYLRLVLSEMRSFTFRTADGGTRPGHEIIDPAWKELVHWHGVENPHLRQLQMRDILRERIVTHPQGGEDLFERFDDMKRPR